MDAHTAYHILGALTTVTIGWQRVDKPWHQIALALKASDSALARKQEMSRLALAFQIQMAGNGKMGEARNAESEGTSTLTRCLVDLFRTHVPESTAKRDASRSAAFSVAMFIAAFIVNLNVIPAAGKLHDMSTLLVAQGAIYGLGVGAAAALGANILVAIWNRVRR